MKRTHAFIVTLLTAALFLSACGSSSGGSGSDLFGAQQEQASQQLPEGYVLIRFPDDTGSDDYGERQETFYADLEKALQNKEEKVCIRCALPQNVMDLYELDHGVFWVKQVAEGSPLWLQLEGDSEKTFYRPYEFTYYDLPDAEIDAMKREIDDAADQILARVPSGADDWATSKAVHDELCKLVTYDQTLEKPHTHDLYGALVNHEAVCSGYSIAFHYLMDKAGIYNTTSYSDDHAWNNVNVLSYDRYIDTTWDDPDINDRNGNPYVFYDHFFLKEEEVTAIDSHAIASGDPHLNYVAEDVPYNYHAHEGYLADSYDLGAITDMFQRQMDAGSNLLTVRFANDSDYQTALAWADGGEDISTLLTNVGYIGSYYFWSNDNVNVINIGLYAAE